MGESGDCRLAVELTQYSCEPSGEDGRTLELTVDLLAQAQIWSRRPVSVLQDLYSIAFQDPGGAGGPVPVAAAGAVQPGAERAGAL